MLSTEQMETKYKNVLKKMNKNEIIEEDDLEDISDEDYVVD